jgi:hypothetical protein
MNTHEKTFGSPRGEPSTTTRLTLNRQEARRLIQTYVDHDNTVRLHSAIGYVTPHDMLAGRQAETHAARDRKLEQARSQRQLRRAAARSVVYTFLERGYNDFAT